MLEYRVSARRIDPGESVARTESAQVRLATGLTGPVDAFNPAELLLASIAACMIKGIERVIPLLAFSLDGVEVFLHAVRQDDPPRIVSIDYELVVDTDEADQRLDLLHKNVRKYGTISNTVALGTRLNGVIRRAS
ncbi:MAG: OsmC family protein [Rhizobium sp.]|nr:OsmC family protein [Rhizobium sp.]